MPRDKIEWTNASRKLSELIPWPRNPRQINKDQAKRLAQSFDEFGQVETIAISPTNEVYNGHQRLNVLMDKHGGDYEVEVRVSSRALTEKEREKLTVFLHKGAAGEWDFDTLANEFELDDLLDWGFEPKELDLDLWAKDEPPDDPGAQIDKAEELREKWGVESGQLWQLGEHRLICGDCTDNAVVERVMGGEKADMVFTDPPYNVAGNSRNFAADKSKAMAELKDAEWDQDFDITTVFPMLEEVMAKDCAVYICTSHWLVQIIWEWMWAWSDFCFYNVWCKPNPMPSLSKRHWTWATELIAYAVRGKHISNFPHDGHALNWWDIAKHKDTEHPTEKPIEVPERALGFSSNKGQIVFDGFSGSGTTLIACERLGRKCRAIEISPAYCAVAIERWVTMTGGEPVLLSEN